MVAKLERSIEGDVARARPLRPGGWEQGLPTAERVDGGWRVVVGSDVGAEPEHVAPAATAARIAADVSDRAADRVRSGELRSTRAINDFVTAERKAISDRAAAALREGPMKGPVVVVTDVETGRPVAGARVGATFLVPPLTLRTLTYGTDEMGRARLPAEPESGRDVSVNAAGYARRPAERARAVATADAPAEIRIAIGRPLVVEVTLVLPDDRRKVLNVYEGDDDESIPPNVRRGEFEPRSRTVTVEFEAEPPPFPGHNPMARLFLPPDAPSDAPPASRPSDVAPPSAVHRVVGARTAAGRELPVLRDAPPADPATFGAYVIGVSDVGNDTVIVIGTLADAREAAAAAEKGGSLATRNANVLGDVAGW